MVADTPKWEYFDGCDLNGGEPLPNNRVRRRPISNRRDTSTTYMVNTRVTHVGQHNALEMVLTMCRLKLREQRTLSRFEPYICGVLPLPPPLPKGSLPPKTVESCCAGGKTFVMDDHAIDKQYRENLHTEDSLGKNQRTRSWIRFVCWFPSLDECLLEPTLDPPSTYTHT